MTAAASSTSATGKHGNVGASVRQTMSVLYQSVRNMVEKHSLAASVEMIQGNRWCDCPLTLLCADDGSEQLFDVCPITDVLTVPA